MTHALRTGTRLSADVHALPCRSPLRAVVCRPTLPKQAREDTAATDGSLRRSRTHNSLDQITQVTDPKGLNTTYTYNGFGDLIAQNSPDSGSTAMARDAAGNLTGRTDARGVQVLHHYDALNRLRQRELSLNCRIVRPRR